MDTSSIMPSPACTGMKRSEITALLDSELIRLRLNRKNSYSFWAHEVWLDRYTDHEKRVDFVSFEPMGGPTCGDGPHLEHGTFSFYEIKSCMADLKSGHGLTFEGDENWLVMPVELYDPYLDETVIKDPQGYVSQHTRRSRCLLYGIGKNGRPTFWEQPKKWGNKMCCRKRSALELLFCIMRALLANSSHSDVSHLVEQYLPRRSLTPRTES